MDRYQAVEKAKPLINNYVNRYKTTGIDPEILKMKAMVIVGQAADKYDESKGDFYGYMNKQLSTLGRFANNAAIIHIPEYRMNKYRQYREIIDEFERTHNRPITVEEMADKAHVPVQEAERILNEFNKQIVSLEELEDTLPDTRLEDEESYIKFIYNITNDPQEKKVIEMTFGLNGSPIYSSNMEMANKLGVSETTIRRIKDRIIRKIKEHNVWHV